MIYNVLPISAVQQSDPVTYICIYIYIYIHIYTKMFEFLNNKHVFESEKNKMFSKYLLQGGGEREWDGLGAWG